MAVVPQKIQAVLDFLDRDLQETTLAAFRVGADGSIEQRPVGPMSFSFRCHGIAVACIADVGADGGRLTLDAVIGSVPYTVEGRAARERMLAAVHARRGVLTSDGREVRARDRIAVPLPLSPVSLIGGMTEFIMRLEPELELLASCLPPSRSNTFAAA
jgi:hypothetical protein